MPKILNLLTKRWQAVEAKRQLVEEDLVDHLFNSSEKRLARILVLLAHVGKDANFEHAVPRISLDHPFY
jgi:hypothetical protein